MWHVPWTPLAAEREVALLIAPGFRSEYLLSKDGFNYVAYFERGDFTGFVHTGLFTDLPDGTRQRFDAVLLRPDEAASRGLGHTLHLVRFDINNGQGVLSAHEPFLLTSITVLDGTPEFPLDPIKAYDAAREALRARFVAERPVLDRMVLKVLGVDAGGAVIPAEQALLVRATWLASEKQLALVLDASVQATVTTPTFADIPCTPCPPGGVCLACGPVTQMVQTRAASGIRGSFWFDAAGRRLRAEFTEPAALR
jgi:hypothetical protein